MPSSSYASFAIRCHCRSRSWTTDRTRFPYRPVCGGKECELQCRSMAGELHGEWQILSRDAGRQAGLPDSFAPQDVRNVLPPKDGDIAGSSVNKPVLVLNEQSASRWTKIPVRANSLQTLVGIFRGAWHAAMELLHHACHVEPRQASHASTVRRQAVLYGSEQRPTLLAGESSTSSTYGSSMSLARSRRLSRDSRCMGSGRYADGLLSGCRYVFHFGDR
jgi:hypothetical protein